MYRQLIFIALASIMYGLPVNGQNKARQQQTDSLFTLHSGNMIMQIDGNKGSRVVSLKLDGEEILGSKDLHPNFYGSTLWLSPEGKWKGQGILDAGPYKTIKFKNGHLDLASQKDTLRGFAFTKQFSANPQDTSISIIYTINNISKNDQEVSPWEVTRVPTGGLAFYPKGTGEPLPKSNLPVQDSIGMIWYPYDSSTANYQKLFRKGGEGWLAYVRHDLVFIKRFPIVDDHQTAPAEVDVEMYVNKDKTYLELENQGHYQLLEPNKSLTYEVKWYVRHLPPNLKAEIGDQALVNYIRNIVKNNK